MSKGSLLKLAARNWKWLLAGGVVAHAHVSGQNVLESGGDLAMASMNMKRGEGETRLGAVTRNVVDAATEPGTTDRILDGVKSSGREARQSVSDLSDASRDLVGGIGGGGGILGTVTGLFKGLTSGISGLLGGGSGLNLGAALMLPLAWFAFGKFGWIGKVAALSMLMYGLSNLFNRHQEPAVGPVLSEGGGRALPTASENFDAIVRQQESGDGEQYNVRSRMS